MKILIGKILFTLIVLCWILFISSLFINRDRYYFISYMSNNDYGNATIIFNGKFDFKKALKAISKEINNDISIIYYNEISKKQFKNFK